jgi:5-formyltetrahydrofolate cyclo-ligase
VRSDPGPDPQLTPSKLALRRTVRAQRQARLTADREQVTRSLARVGLELPVVRAAGCLAVYASLPDEPGTDLLRTWLRERGARVLLPVVVDDTRLDWAPDTGTVRPAGPLALPEPTGDLLGPGALGAADVVIVPALAVDTDGTRLGRGKGYYDRALAHARPDACVLAAVHDDELLDARTTPVPREAHDRRVDGVLTPGRWVFFGPGPG